LVDRRLLGYFGPVRVTMTGEPDVIGVEEISVGIRHTGGRAVIDNVCALVLDRGGAAANVGRVGVTLQAGLTIVEEREVSVVHDNQIRVVVITREVQPQREHKALDRGCTRRNGAAALQGRSRRLEDAFPERVGGRIDATNGAGSGIGDERLQPIDLVGGRAVAVDVAGEAVASGTHGILQLVFDELDNAFFSAVLANFETGSNHVNGNLLPREICRSEHFGLRDAQRVEPAVTLIGAIFRVIERNLNLPAAGNQIDATLFRETLVQRGVVGHVVFEIGVFEMTVR